MSGAGEQDALQALARCGGALHELRHEESSARTFVAPELEGRVMTTAIGSIASAAWMDPRAFALRGSASRFHNYGGQDRLWIGPEGGDFGWFFDPGAPCEGSHWRVPSELNVGPMEVVDASHWDVHMQRSLTLTNRRGDRFSGRLERSVRVLSRNFAHRLLKAPIPDEVTMAAAVTTNRLLCESRSGAPLVHLWSLSQLPASPRAVVMAPLGPGDPAAGRPEVEDRYFGKIPEERLWREGSVLCMRADGRRTSKFGIGAHASTGFAGSFSPEQELLTIAAFPVQRTEPYANNLWTATAAAPFGGDVFQSYNSDDGRFFELESVSPARFLEPAQELSHWHATLFAVGPRRKLSDLARSVLGSCLTDL
ncbi:MAG: hypothetical protein JNJ88_03075 [Planctomycetes bacterium]|nr:hypothetical protein [Planctomycetota bacterium]